MNVRDLTLELRPRSDWEAVDLGTALAKRYFHDLFKMGVCGFGPFFLLFALLGWFLPWMLLIVIWWFKPIYDRFYLYYLSRRIFGQEVTVKETWGEWRQLVFKDFFSLLFIRRFVGNRSMTLAVSSLENLKGSKRSKRCAVVTRVGGGQAFLIGIGGMALEALGMMSILGLIAFLIPEGQGPQGEFFLTWLWKGGVMQSLIILGVGLCYGFLVLLLEPMYLAGGFALYLNSRTSQEAWDIELRFRELASRVAKTRIAVASNGDSQEFDRGVAVKPAGSGFQLGGSKQVPLILLLCAAMALLTFHAPGAEGESQEVIEKVLSDKDFEWHVEKGKRWVRNHKNDGEKSDLSAPLAGMEALLHLVGILALVLLAIALMVLFVYLLKGRLAFSDSQGKEGGFKRPAPKVVMGMEITPESLPEDLLTQAKSFWNQGQSQLALSLLYRGALSQFVLEKEVSIEGSDTESECLQHVQEATPGLLANYFQSLSLSWMKAAYSHEEVLREDFENLCATWPFERRGK